MRLEGERLPYSIPNRKASARYESRYANLDGPASRLALFAFCWWLWLAWKLFVPHAMLKQ